MKRVKKVVAAILCVALIGLYVATFVLSLLDSENARNLLTASVYMTVVVPVVLYAMALVAKVLGGNEQEDSTVEKYFYSIFTISIKQNSSVFLKFPNQIHREENEN